VDFKREVNFQEADRRYIELKRQLDTGTISPEEFDAQLRQLMVQDQEGRWWAKSRKTGEWNYHDGSAWVRGTPPGYQQPPRRPPVGSMSDRQFQPEQGERLPSSQTTFFRGRWRLGAPRWVIMAAGLAGMALVGVSIVVWLLVPYVQPYVQGEIEEPLLEEDPKPAPGYQLVKDDSGNLRVEVPSGWEVTTGEDSEEGPGSNWSSFGGESVGSSITASPDLYAWHNIPGTPGIYIVASRGLAQRYTDDELVASGPNDFSEGCELGPLQDFDRSSYPGKMQTWNCDQGTFLTLAAAPESRECVVIVQIGMYSEADRESAQHILNAFEADCRKIA
jgi:hypothetical protein